jgi:hypothetical protein
VHAPVSGIERAGKDSVTSLLDNSFGDAATELKCFVGYGKVLTGFIHRSY